MKLIKNSIFMIFVVIISFTTTEIKAQDFGADVVSSYVWRGTQFGTGPAVQPWFTLPELTSGLELGVWGSFPLSDDGGEHASGQTYELDLYASYDFGPFALTVTNYTFNNPNGVYGATEGSYPNSDYELFDGDMEVTASTSLGAIGLTVGYFTDLEALYVEAGTTVAGMDLAIGYGSDGDGAFYAGGDSGLVNVSLGGSKDIKITDDYSLPLFGSFIYNPDAESAFLVFGMSF